jgi:hypothetical protein
VLLPRKLDADPHQSEQLVARGTGGHSSHERTRGAGESVRHARYISGRLRRAPPTC